MKKLAEIKLKNMFTAYGSEISDGHVQYVCWSCFQRFVTDWNIRANNMNPWVARGSFVRCPYCGQLHDKFIGYGSLKEYIPYIIKLKVIAYKAAIELKVEYEANAFTDLFQRKWCKGKETFRINFTGESYFKKEVFFNSEEMESAVYPINQEFYSAIVNGSILRFLKHGSLALQTHRTELTHAVRVIRETVTKSLKTRFKDDLTSLYVNASSERSGMFLVPILSMVARIQKPEGKNIEPYTKFENKLTTLFMWKKSDDMPENWLELMLQYMNEGEDETGSILKIVGLPNKDGIRNMVKENIHSINNIKAALRICRNYDYAVRLAQAINISVTREEFLKEMLPIYREDGIVRMAERAKKFNLDDCARLYKLLNEENKGVVRAKGVRLRDLHDWMSLRHKTQDHKNQMFNVPEHVVRRLSMQMSGLSFSMPSESLELVKIGHDLHNCVASYSEDMLNNKSWIVVITNGEGKRLACLEIKQDTVVQAKINGNIGVRENREINGVVMQWVKKAKLAVKTEDISSKEVARMAS